MKKVLSLFTFLSLFASQPLWAAESKAGGVELSGNFDIVTGWQHDDKNSLGTAIAGQLGEFRGAAGPRSDTFNFYIDQIELDLNKSFGENIRLRADLDFGRQLSGSARNTNSAFFAGGPAPLGTSNFELEQGYITFNLKGAEVLFGRFNAPIGYYVVDRADNPTISFSTPFKYLTPTNVTGAKVYYSFSDHYDWHVYVINNLSDSTAYGFPSTSGSTPNPGGFTGVGRGYGAIPSFGTRFGFNWGKEDTKSTVGISYVGGPNRFGCNSGTSSCNAHWTHLIDLDFAVKFTPKFLFAGEGVYRQDNTDISGGKNDKAFGGFFVLNYDMNDKWRFFFRYGFLQDRTGFYTGGTPGAVGATPATPAIGENIHDFAIGAGYQITEGAKMKVEYAPTLFDARGPGSAGVSNSLSHGFALEFAYNF
ncbi:MAG: porin [bacterium]